jgi:hypothetical protein
LLEISLFVSSLKHLKRLRDSKKFKGAGVKFDESEALSLTEPSAVAPDTGVNFRISVNPRVADRHLPKLSPGSGATALGSVMQRFR